jgi:hypothetical protein
MVLRDRFGAVAQRLVTAGAWSGDDFESLSSLGVIRFPESLRTPVGKVQLPDAVDTWMNRNEIGQFDGIEGEVGTQDSHARFAVRFPTMMILKAISANHIGNVAGAIMHGWRTDAVRLSPVGLRLGEIVLDQLIAGGAATA